MSAEAAASALRLLFAIDLRRFVRRDRLAGFTRFRCACRRRTVALADFERMNAVYREVFGATVPARTTVEVAALPLPGLLVEIDVIAVAGDPA